MSLEERKAAVFAVLVVQNEGLNGKAPSYLAEKLLAVVGFQEGDDPEALLSIGNLMAYLDWCRRWHAQPPEATMERIYGCYPGLREHLEYLAEGVTGTGQDGGK